MDDKKSYTAVCNALKAAKFSENEIETIWRLVSSIVLLVSVKIFILLFISNFLVFMDILSTSLSTLKL